MFTMKRVQTTIHHQQHISKPSILPLQKKYDFALLKKQFIFLESPRCISCMLFYQDQRQTKTHCSVSNFYH